MAATWRRGADDALLVTLALTRCIAAPSSRWAPSSRFRGPVRKTGLTPQLFHIADMNSPLWRYRKRHRFTQYRAELQKIRSTRGFAAGTNEGTKPQTHADHAVRIEMHHQVDSLNVVMACLACYFSSL